MKLLLKRNMDDLYVLCDEQGEMLPAQVRVSLISEVGAPQKLTVEFYCDGESIRVVGDGNAGTTDPVGNA